RYGENIVNTSTVGSWVKESINLLAIIYSRIKHKVLNASYVQGDETTIKVLDPLKKSGKHQGYLWGYHAPLEKLVLMEYGEGRAAEYPDAFLGDFHGVFQTDAYGAYDTVLRNKANMRHVCCWSHARRNFTKAMDSDKRRATAALDMIRELYRVEAMARENMADLDEVLRLRTTFSVPMLENIKQAFAAIRMNLLRAILTIFIIAFGIMSLISMLTAVDGMKSALYSSFASVGSNTYTISYESAMSGMQRHGRREKDPVPISYNQATSFQQRYNFPGQVSLSFDASDAAIVQFRSVKTAPKINVIGADQYHLPSSGLQLLQGRNFTSQEIQYGRKVAIIGNSLHEDLFGPQEAVGKTISVDNKKYLVIGSLKPKGTSFGPSQDNRIIIPLLAAQNDFSISDLSYNIAVQVKDVELLKEMG
ncbi:MAG: hypothetical protein EOO01_35795, partial [Chitinophagaceae bacterium]